MTQRVPVGKSRLHEWQTIKSVPDNYRLSLLHQKFLLVLDLHAFLSPVTSYVCNKVDLLDASAIHSLSRSCIASGFIGYCDQLSETKIGYCAHIFPLPGHKE